MTPRLAVAALAAILAGSAQGAAAHHSYAMFDPSRTLTASGTVAKVEWTNPHVFVWMYVPKAEGGYTLYAFESDAVSRLARMGWSATTLSPGDKVVIAYAPLRDGRPGGKLITARLANGVVMATTNPNVPARQP